MPEPRPGQSLVYAWSGPPSLELWTEEVTRNGRSWLQHRLVAEHGTPGVVIVAVADGHFAMVEHWRPAAGRSFLEFPRGFGSPAGSGPDLAVRDAARELEEETGLQGTRFRVLGSVWADSSLLQGHAVVVATTVDRSAEPLTRDGEIDGFRWVPVDSVPALMAAGEIADGLTLSAYAFWTGDRTPGQ
ncbi:NUDIX hydrolase [Arthrobacter sp. zg-Y1171]|uniref:NUDIX hydrolase n=1 Tax=Arthrobacter sp. zg-Y1171 TaxID=2964610 RepID=UPI002101E66B|nr:NUDIX hydrolase [Arthrobacter sp. zg-Y1171]MCQ1995571.1 NUDIX hydrolase [Arthrobacter sp. zg-Y1171]UWX80404.1 NUDIX hydrolase [Arthrobacter sp. zg-Y1171]